MRSAAVVNFTRWPRRQAGELADRVREVGLANARWPDQHAVGLLGDEVQGRRAEDEVAINRLRIVEVVGIERGEREDGRPLERALGAMLGLDAQFLANEMIEQRGG